MKIDDFGYDGEGVGRQKGKVCFVPYTIVGEEVEFDVQKETASFIKGTLNNVIKASPERQVAPCPYFTRCGGCDFQHIGYQNELKLKKELFLRQLKKVNCNCEVKVVEAKNTYCYRNKIKLFPCEKGLGLKQAGSDKVIHIEKCLLIDDKMNFALEKLNSFVKNNHLQAKLNNVYIRKFEKQYCVYFVFNQELEFDFSGLDLVLGDFKIFYSNKNKLYSYSQKPINCITFGLQVEYDVRAFKQINDEICDKLYHEVLSLCSGKKVLNAYSGAGILSAMLAKSAMSVTGVELGTAEHESAQKLKEKNGIKNLININDDCKNVNFNGFDYIIVDPPRGGLDSEVCSAINSSGVKQIIYISCNRASLVRDLQRLTNFEVSAVTIFDMFPRTSNFEILTKLSLKTC